MFFIVSRLNRVYIALKLFYIGADGLRPLTAGLPVDA